MKSTTKSTSLLAVVLLFSLAALVLAGCYIDNSIDSGEGYGFRIGDGKQETFTNARKAFTGKTTYFLAPIDKQGFGPHKKIEFNKKDYNLMKFRDAWDFYFDSGYRDSLKLQFSEGRLTNVHRHKKSIELP